MCETTYLSPKEFSNRMDGISEKLVRQLLKDGIIPALKSGRSARIPLKAGIEAIETYVLKQHQQQPKAYVMTTAGVGASLGLPQRGKLTDKQRARLNANAT